MQEKSTLIEHLNNDLEIALSQIESGCLTTITDDKNLIIIKENNINFFDKIQRIDISFEHIERPEFPTIAMRLKVNTSDNLNLRYEYFFLTEAEEEINFLDQIVRKESIYILFTSNENYTQRYEKINNKEVDKLSSVLSRLN